MATATLNLIEADIIEAIRMWTIAKGHRPLTGAVVSLHHDKGDRPTDRESFSASIQVEPLPRADYPDPRS